MKLVTSLTQQLRVVISRPKVILRGIMIFIILLVIFVAVSCVCAFSSRDRATLLRPLSTIWVDGIERRYLVSMPRKSPKKILIGLHAFGDNPRKFAYYTALHNTVDDETVVIYPSAISPSKKGIVRGWNAGFCCGSGWVGKVDDVAFLEQLIKDISAQYSVQSNGVFIAGFSNGAFMAQRLASEKPQLIGGVIAASGTVGTVKEALKPQSPIPILLMHGKQDKTVPYAGGANTDNPDFEWLPFATTLSTWQKVNGSTDTSAIVYDDLGHSWNGWRTTNFWHKKPQASIEAANFLRSINH